MHKILYGPCLPYSFKVEGRPRGFIILTKWRPRAIQSLIQNHKVTENLSLLTLSSSWMNEVRIAVGCLW